MSTVVLSKQKPYSPPQRSKTSKSRSRKRQPRPQETSFALVTATTGCENWMSWVQIGVRVQVIDNKNAEKLHEFNRVPWSKKDHCTWLGKVGVVTHVTDDGESCTVKFFEWSSGISDTTVGKKLLETDLVWYVGCLKPATHLYFINGDRPILRQINIQTGREDYHHVSLRVLDHGLGSEPTYTLRTTKMHTMTWKQSERGTDVLLPVYIGRDRGRIMRERSSALVDLAADCTAARVLHGTLSGENGKQLQAALLKWPNDNGEQFRIAAQRYPDQVNIMINDRTPLMLAVEQCNWTAVVGLIAMGAQREAVDSKNNTLIHIAAEKGHVRVLEGLLLFIEKEINRVNADGDTPLHIASRNLHAACVDRLLNFNFIQSNIQNGNGDTVLHVICNQPESSITCAILGRLLGNPRINPNIINHEGLTPIQVAIVRHNPRCIDMLVHSRPSLLSVDSRLGLSPLQMAAASGRQKIVETLLQFRGEVSIEHKTTVNGRTALHLAVEKWFGQADKDLERLATVQSLVSASICVNTSDKDGQTACHLLMRQVNRNPQAIDRNMMFAFRNCNRGNLKLDEMATKLRPHWQLACLCYLITRGADLLVQDSTGETVIDCCLDPILKDALKEIVSQKSRTCLPMTNTRTDFDTSEVHMCTFNCEDSVANVEFIPCGHRVLCSKCAKSTPLKRCPMCYGTISSAVDLEKNVIELGSAFKFSVTSDDKAPKLAEDEVKRIAEEAAKQAKIDMELEKKREIQALREKLEQLEMETSCTICMDARPSVAFNCGHTACSECTEHLKLCHICREPITKKQTIYS